MVISLLQFGMMHCESMNISMIKLQDFIADLINSLIGSPD